MDVTDSDKNVQNDGDLLRKFEDLLIKIRSLVHDALNLEGVEPRIGIAARHKTDEATETETGVHRTRYHLEYIERRDWFSATTPIFEKLKSHTEYSEFRDSLNRSVGHDASRELERASDKLIEQTFENLTVDANEALRFLLHGIRGEPVPAWSDIDIHGVSLTAKSITLTFPERKLVFRQLGLADFEEEFHPDVGIFRRDRFMPPPGCVLRIEIKAKSGWELQIEAEKARMMLRLASVCSVEFAQEAHGTESIFPFIGRRAIGGIHFVGHIRHGRHGVIFSAESQEKLQFFWNNVEKHLPPDMVDLVSKPNTPLAIAYERYCDALFANGPVERKFAAAIMGLEALYLADEPGELSYRLALRISKVLSKVGMPPKEIQHHVKSGYNIRSAHVHGSHLSSKERSKIQTRMGVSPEDLSTKLLNYLRIAILHLICSGQSKPEFLSLIEDSLIDRMKDDALGELLKREQSVLCINFP